MAEASLESWRSRRCKDSVRLLSSRVGDAHTAPHRSGGFADAGARGGTPGGEASHRGARAPAWRACMLYCLTLDPEILTSTTDPLVKSSTFNQFFRVSVITTVYVVYPTSRLTVYLVSARPPLVKGKFHLTNIDVVVLDSSLTLPAPSTRIFTLLLI